MSENVVAVRSIEIVTAEITMIRDNARKVFLESVIQIGTRLEEAKQKDQEGLVEAAKRVQQQASMQQALQQGGLMNG